MDTVFYNGVIHTMAGRTVSALAVQNGRIALVGTDASCLGLPTATYTSCRPAWSATAWTCGA